MTKKGCLHSFIMCISFMVFIFFAGLGISKLLSDQYKNTIDENGVYVNAVIDEKKSNSKGHTIHFAYQYKGRGYKSQEQSLNIFRYFEVGDTITIKIDSLNPSRSYIVLLKLK